MKLRLLCKKGKSVSDLYGYSKIKKFFQKHKLSKEKAEFDYLLKYGGGMRELRLLLWFWADQVGVSFDATDNTIRLYAKQEGLWNTRQVAIRARKSKRKFLRKDKHFGTEIYRKLLT